MRNITVVGGGNSTHVLIPLLSKSGFTVNLMTRKPEKWSNSIKLDYMKPSGEHLASWTGEIEKASAEPKDVIPQADIIILCMPVSVYRETLHKIAPYIDNQKKVYVGTVYGQGGFNWMTDEIVDKFNLKQLVTFAIGLIPWICRTKKYGHEGIVYGAKPLNLVAVKPKNEFDFLNETFLSKIAEKCFGYGEFALAEHFISLTMSVDNQIIHTARMYGLYLEHGGEWESLEDVPYFYRDFSPKSAEILAKLDADYTLIRCAIKKKYSEHDYKWMMDYIAQDNITNKNMSSSVMDTFENSQTLGAIRTPVVEKGGKWVLDKKHRFFYDDVFYGLCIAKWFAQKMAIEVENIDDLLIWAQNYLGEEIIKDGKLSFYDNLPANPMKYGVPESYGLCSLDDVID